jgi:hypothetical protein
MTSSQRGSARRAPVSAPPDPAIAEFLDLRLDVVRVPLSPALSTDGLENARSAFREIGRNANAAIRNADVRRTDEPFASVCFAARSHIAGARRRLASGSVENTELVLARRALYGGLALIAEALSASDERPRALPPHAGRSALFLAFVTQVVAATRANTSDIAWALEVAESELTVAVAHPHFLLISHERRTLLRILRAEMAAWFSGAREADAGLALLNRLMLLVDTLNH